MKRTLVAAALALLSTLAAAQSPQLLVWINGDKGYNGLQKVGDAFTAATGVKVVVQHPEGAPDKFQAAAAAGKGPDVFCWPHDRVGEWAKSGLIVPVRPGPALREEIEDSAWKAFTYRGRLWGYPIAIEAVGLIVNRALVPEPPRTWDEVIALDERLKAQGKKAILWDYNKSFFTWPLLAGPGGEVFGRDARGDFDPMKVGVNNAGALAGALKTLIRAGAHPVHMTLFRFAYPIPTEDFVWGAMIDPASGKVVNRAADNHVVQSESYVSPAGPVPLSDTLPRYAPRPDIAAVAVAAAVGA